MSESVIYGDRPTAGRPRHFRASPGWSFGAQWLGIFVVLLLMSVAWALGTPLRASPDEGAHIARAAAIVRGEWIGQPEPPGHSPAETTITVPLTFVEGGHLCYAFKPRLPAGCQPPLPTSGVEVRTATYVGHYPPLFYLAVGWPSLLTSSASGVYLMRILGAILCSGFVALAIVTALRWSRSSLLAPAVAVAASPMAVFLGSTVNPSGLEVATAICAWTAATVLVVDHPRQPDRSLLVILTGSTMALLLVRGLSPLWAALIALLLLPMAWRRVDLRGILRRRDARLCLVGLCAASVLALAWIVLARALTEVALAVPPRSTSDAVLAERVLGQTGLLFHQAVGVFGYVDTPVPLLTLLLWMAMAGGLIAVAALLGRRRAVVSLGAAIATSVLLPAALSYAAIRHVGPIAQGRYFMPLYVGVPLVAGAVIDDGVLPRLATRRLVATFWASVAVGQVAAFYWSLRRFSVGFFGPLWPDAHVVHGWSPPVRPVVLDAAMAVLGAALFVLLAHVLRTDRRPAATPENEDPMPTMR